MGSNFPTLKEIMKDWTDFEHQMKKYKIDFEQLSNDRILKPIN